MDCAKIHGAQIRIRNCPKTSCLNMAVFFFIKLMSSIKHSLAMTATTIRASFYIRPRTHGNVSLRFCQYCLLFSRESRTSSSLLETIQKRRKTFPCAHSLRLCANTVSFSLAFYIVLRPQGIRKQIKTLRKRHHVHIALGHVHTYTFSYCFR